MPGRPDPLYPRRSAIACLSACGVRDFVCEKNPSPHKMECVRPLVLTYPCPPGHLPLCSGVGSSQGSRFGLHGFIFAPAPDLIPPPRSLIFVLLPVAHQGLSSS